MSIRCPQLTWIQWLTFPQHHGPLARCVELGVAHAPGMPGTFSPPPRVSDPGMHHGTCVTHACACATRNFTYLARGPWPWRSKSLTQVSVGSSWQQRKCQSAASPALCYGNPQSLVDSPETISLQWNNRCTLWPYFQLSVVLFACIRNYNLKI